MRQILTNAGFNGLEKVMAAKASPPGYGIDINTGDPVDMWKMGVIDPLMVKTMALQAAGEIAKSVLRVDRNLAAEDLSQQAREFVRSSTSSAASTNDSSAPLSNTLM